MPTLCIYFSSLLLYHHVYSVFIFFSTFSILVNADQIWEAIPSLITDCPQSPVFSLLIMMLQKTALYYIFYIMNEQMKRKNKNIQHSTYLGQGSTLAIRSSISEVLFLWDALVQADSLSWNGPSLVPSIAFFLWNFIFSMGVVHR